MFLVSYLDEEGRDVLIGACESESEIDQVIERYLLSMKPAKHLFGALSNKKLDDLKVEIDACTSMTEKIAVMDRCLGTNFLRMATTVKMVKV